jgi:hypothetical protein
MLRLSRKSRPTPFVPSNDRREHPRHRTDIETVCRPVSEAVEWPARILDVGVGGIRLRLTNALKQGTMIRIDLPKVSGANTSVLACVMHTHQVERSAWEVGCNFSLELSEDEVRAFGAEKTPAGRDDLRAWVRHSARGTVVYRELPGTEGPPDVAELVNLSPAGVGLIVPGPVEPGTALLVSLKRLDDKPDRTILACVVYQSEREDGKFAIGCNFLHQLPEKELDDLLWASSF